MMSDVGAAVGRISSAGGRLFESKPRRSSKAKIVRGSRKEDPNLSYLKTYGFSSDKSLSPKGITRRTRRLTSSGSVFIWRGWDGMGLTSFVWRGISDSGVQNWKARLRLSLSAFRVRSGFGACPGKSHDAPIPVQVASAVPGAGYHAGPICAHWIL
jgi:hypothetical protein